MFKLINVLGTQDGMSPEGNPYNVPSSIAKLLTQSGRATIAPGYAVSGSPDDGYSSFSGWTAIPSIAVVEGKMVSRLTWVGGSGQPPTSIYRGPTGLVATAELAVDLLETLKPLPELDPTPTMPVGNGWSPVPAIVTDGARKVMRITWAGGTGTAPADGFVGATPGALVATAALAVDVAGGGSVAEPEALDGDAILAALQSSSPSKRQEIGSLVSGSGVATLLLADYGLNSYPMTAVGNSIVAGSGINSKAPFLQQMPPKSAGRLKFLANHAVGGKKSAEIITEQLPLVSAKTKLLPFMEGVNDAGNSSPVSVAQHIANYDTICKWALERRIAPLCIETPPSSYVLTSKTLMEKYALAERIYCEDNGIPFVAPWGKYTDVDGTWADAVVGDGVHPTIAVHNYASSEVLSQFESRRPAVLIPRSDTDQAGVIKTNALLSLDTAGVPTSWTIGGVTSSNMSAATLPVRGRWSNHVCTGIAASTNNVFRSLGNPLTYGAVGDILRIVGWFRFAPSSNMSLACRLQITATPSNSSTWLFDAAEAFGETYFTADVAIPANTTGNSYLFVQHSNASSGTYSGEFGFACLQVYNVTQHRFVA